jgi:glyoxylase-like metal-dependent hydrolase (beta-lactamase superfamily II)
VEAVLLTHAHADHTGFAERARTQAGARIWVHHADAAVATGAKPGKNDGGMARYLLRAEFYRTTLSLMRRGGAKIIPVLEVSAFGDREVLDVPGRPGPSTPQGILRATPPCSANGTGCCSAATRS